MRNAKKAIGLALAAVLLVTASVFGTMAYLTSTAEVNNTFTVGDVKITLDEAKVGANGKAIAGEGAGRVQKNDYKLIPGLEYDKDPTVHVLADSEACYVRMLVTMKVDDLAGALTVFPEGTNLNDIFKNYDENWVRFGNAVIDETANTVKYEYRYASTVPATNDQVEDLEPLFEKIAIPGTLTNDNMAKLNGLKIDIVAHAIQADGFANADAAWDAFTPQS